MTTALLAALLSGCSMDEWARDQDHPEYTTPKPVVLGDDAQAKPAAGASGLREKVLGQPRDFLTIEKGTASEGKSLDFPDVAGGPMEVVVACTGGGLVATASYTEAIEGATIEQTFSRTYECDGDPGTLDTLTTAAPGLKVTLTPVKGATVQFAVGVRKSGTPSA
ncbi:hypothetical protein [Dermacoccus barathri]|uniref:hypothetical protein n=1 Tax=Dermacoccus barathri TaxID=322601 RepID=UPI00187A00DF|nr:hypothetical protein [Dermacoccus barathri]MBE7371849.1 hypothetical protein [Dermacoccus barathri]